MRRIAEPVAIAAILTALAAPAAAQHHHHHAPGDAEAAPRIQAHAGLSLEAGQVDFLGGERDYQGLALMAGASRGRFELAAHVPFYRLELGDSWGEGPGDPHLEARWVALRSGELDAGVSSAVMPPVGDDDKGLAMGHWMIMTGGFARLTRGRFASGASLGYGGALGGGGHAEHGGGVWPPVAPMNGHEIEGSLQETVTLGRFGLGASLSGATPLGDSLTLALFGVGATINLGRMELGVGVGHGLLDHPAGLRATTHAMASF